MNRWYLLFIGLAIGAMMLLIWLDARESSSSENAGSLQSQPLSGSQHHQEFGDTDEVYSDFHGDVDMDNPDSINRRIGEIERRLEEIDPRSRQAVPFYGELMMLYQNLGREDGAAEASRHMAMILDDPDDWWNAALLSYQWAMRVPDAETQAFYMDRAESSFEEAVKLSSNPDMHTDYAVVLFARNKYEPALEVLNALIDKEKANYRTYLYAGMILYRSDKKEESISYINKSVEKAGSRAEMETIQAVTAGTQIEI